MVKHDVNSNLNLQLNNQIQPSLVLKSKKSLQFLNFLKNSSNNAFDSWAIKPLLTLVLG